MNFSLVRAMIEEFTREKWQRIQGSGLHAPTLGDSRARRWARLHHVHQKGGNYGFLFPRAYIAKERKITLDGPSRRKIAFCFSALNQPTFEGFFVAYVGKAANLKQRFQWHFSLAAVNTGAQVQFGLVKAGICPDRPSAVDFMLKHATIVYRELAGDANAANRDLLELSLCARFAPPFNIKSER